jgi:hypothetical protein
MPSDSTNRMLFADESNWVVDGLGDEKKPKKGSFSRLHLATKSVFLFFGDKSRQFNTIMRLDCDLEEGENTSANKRSQHVLPEGENRRRFYRRTLLRITIKTYSNFLFFFLFQEMVISSTEKRNWRGICIALLVISAVLSIIVFSIFLLSPGERTSARFIADCINLNQAFSSQMSLEKRALCCM